MTNPDPHSGSAGGDPFPNSMWTLIGVAQQGKEAVSNAALNTLCKIYWFPIYGYIRHTGAGPEDAQDLTQGYFMNLLQRSYLDQASREKGKFRAFLLADVKYYLANERRRARSQKRGGGIPLIPIAEDGAEARWAHQPVDQFTPDQLFDRQWATTLLTRVMETLRNQYQTRDRVELFESLKQFISVNAGEESYSEVASRLGKDLNYVKVNVHRLRQHFRKLLEEEVSHTVNSPGEIANEIRYLAASLV